MWAIDTGLPEHEHVTDQAASQLTAQQRDGVVAIAYARKAGAARAAGDVGRPESSEELIAAAAAAEGSTRRSAGRLAVRPDPSI